jgi:hypothetical protein
MAKQSGLGSTVTVDDSGGTPRIISNDVQSWQVAMPRGVLDVTGVDKTAIERIVLLADFSTSLVTTAINFAAAPSFHDCFKTVTSSNAQRTTAILCGTGGGTVTAEVLYTDYQINRGQDGSLGATVPGVLSNGTAPAWT